MKDDDQKLQYLFVKMIYSKNIVVHDLLFSLLSGNFRDCYSLKEPFFFLTIFVNFNHQCNL